MIKATPLNIALACDAAYFTGVVRNGLLGPMGQSHVAEDER